MDYKKINKKKLNFAEKKNYTLQSLKDVNYFLNTLNKVCIIKKILKK